MDLASNALTTLEAVKKNLNGTSVDIDDDLIKQKINEVSEFIESYTKRKFGIGTRTEKYAGTGTPFLTLRQFPVISIISITLNGAAVDMAETDLYEDSGMIYRKHGWQNSIERNITIQYEAGYVLPKDATTNTPRTLPYDLEGACIIMVTTRYINRDAEGLQERRAGDFTEKFVHGMPTAVKLVLEKYRRVNGA